jgi:hypothetical protein
VHSRDFRRLHAPFPLPRSGISVYSHGLANSIRAPFAGPLPWIGPIARNLP